MTQWAQSDNEERLRDFLSRQSRQQKVGETSNQDKDFIWFEKLFEWNQLGMKNGRFILVQQPLITWKYCGRNKFWMCTTILLKEWWWAHCAMPLLVKSCHWSWLKPASSVQLFCTKKSTSWPWSYYYFIALCIYWNLIQHYRNKFCFVHCNT